jgi:sigma-B regulation protein RsbU (phosphoserine phosphatase)
MASEIGFLKGDWQERLALILDMMREMSLQTDPQQMVRAYGQKVRRMWPRDRNLSLSRRGLQAPHYMITRSSTWQEAINPWKEPERLPHFEGGLLAEFIYGNRPAIISDLSVSPNEPAFEYLGGMRSLVAIPMFDQGESLNMVISLSRQPGAFKHEVLPEMVWLSNLFGRATHNLVLADQLKEAYRTLDHELKNVGEIQRSLLPAHLPNIPLLDLAAYYQPSQRAGGDYYDFFPLEDGRWGIFIADVSGHGTPAAVLMAVTHCIAHLRPDPAAPPAEVLRYLNGQLARLYTRKNDTFVTAFYAVYDAARRRLTYSSAGHNPPRLKRCQDGTLTVLDQATSLPLGIFPEDAYREAVQELQQGDQIIFYTDGITEAHNVAGEMFGTERLDQMLENCSVQASGLLSSVLQAVEEFAQGRTADDDRTMIVARVQ